ncbi:MAG: efflux RND transporter periplasmic adaptor subunit [Gammaproteobacteria bacterium]|nr:efflux RND transporter periplasmic adaptor subunit [Gammaproteobacteria bacterium]
MQRAVKASVLGVCCIWGLAACHSKPEETKSSTRKVIVSVTSAIAQDINITEETIGEVNTRQAPQLAAEVSGKLLRIHADVGQKVRRGQLLASLDDRDQVLARNQAHSEIKRLEALLKNQERQTERARGMVKDNFATQSMLDDSEGQLSSMQEQLSAARSRLETAQLNVDRARIVSPIDGRIEERLVAAGDYIRPGTTIFRLTTTDQLYAFLPVPENLGPKMRVGLPVELVSPAAPQQVIKGKIAEIRPMVERATQSINLVAEFDNPGHWIPGASVRGTIILERRKGAILVPEPALVKRPAGDVVYVIVGDKTAQRLVEKGARINGKIEITKGLKAGEIVAVDGAGFLTDKATVVTQEWRP